MASVKYYEELLKNPNVKAYLLTLRLAEGTLGTDGYRTFVGGTKFESFAVHPNKYFKKYDSRATGAYQINIATWKEAFKALSLPDFSPHSQDIAAVYLLDHTRNGHYYVLNGDIVTAIKKTNGRWVSLPGAKHDSINKHSIDLPDALKFFHDSGGIFSDINQKVFDDIMARVPKLSTKTGKTSLLAPDATNSLNVNNEPIADIKLILPRIALADNSRIRSPVINRANVLSPALKNMPEKGNSQPRIELYPRAWEFDTIQKGSESLNDSTEKIFDPFKTFKDQPPAIMNFQKKMKNSFLDYPSLIYNSPVQELGKYSSDLSASSMHDNLRERSIFSLSEKGADSNGFLIDPQSDGFDMGGGNSNNPDTCTLPANTGRIVNLNLNTPLIGNFTVSTNGSASGLDDLRYKVEEVLLEVLNSANTIS